MDTRRIPRGDIDVIGHYCNLHIDKAMRQEIRWFLHQAKNDEFTIQTEVSSNMSLLTFSFCAKMLCLCLFPSETLQVSHYKYCFAGFHI